MICPINRHGSGFELGNPMNSQFQNPKNSHFENPKFVTSSTPEGVRQVTHGITPELILYQFVCFSTSTRGQDGARIHQGLPAPSTPTTRRCSCLLTQSPEAPPTSFRPRTEQPREQVVATAQHFWEKRAPTGHNPSDSVHAGGPTSRNNFHSNNSSRFRNSVSPHRFLLFH